MKRGRRGIFLVVTVVGALMPLPAAAQAYPVKPVRVLVPFPAGSIPDVVARLVSEKLSPALGQPVLVENRVGAGGRIAATAAARAAPDGYTLLLGSTSTQSVAPYVVKNMPYNPLQDFTPIANAASAVSGLIAHASLPVRSVKEFVEYARRNPGRISYGSNGIGSTHHLRGELIRIAAGIDMVHVPYGGSNELMAAITSGQVQMTFFATGAIRPHVQAGRVRMLAVTTPRRYPGLPDLPTIAEELPGYEPIVDWFAFFGPAGLARPIVTQLNGEMVKALHAADVRAKLEALTLFVIASSPEELAEQMRAEAKIYARVAKAAAIVPE
ncbi:MAG: tripartite tricarboxylate transporter substrate binding protein [Burkholderiales bacterium]|nr:tripartite tricarboxylate transporter substrate binding protein [Burkholderiales bacterium]